tara:strand:+ start:180 stop:833 length:654 start_codon:yes stop_codon:yes gene_type:complete
MIIAIDGPAGSGKSTTARLLADKLKFIYLDTGAMYRAVTLYFLTKKIDFSNSFDVQTSLKKLDLKIEFSDNIFTVLLDNQDISGSIRNHKINNSVSDVSKISQVRKKMVKIQRSFSKGKDIVIEGRDIGSYVFPEADFKFFLVADILARAKRRFNEMSDSSLVNLDTLVSELRKRDQIDSNRAISPLIKTDDALEIDTTSLTIKQQVNKLYNIITNK